MTWLLAKTKDIRFLSHNINPQSPPSALKVDKNNDLIKGYVEHKETELEDIFLAYLDCKERGITL